MHPTTLALVVRSFVAGITCSLGFQGSVVLEGAEEDPKDNSRTLGERTVSLLCIFVP